ncbi:cupin domain-containing protein [Eubacterium xylanophilum]|uniref:cupin domain-containing protein n=1 Tax=Eubacterium xylanophilum TaxID=39497 RepID=UPI0004793B91|nr:hypothetical protein [Eubacterium xylanophilum]
MKENIIERDYVHDFLCLHKKSVTNGDHELHKHNTIELLFIIRGEGDVLIGEDKYNFTTPCICVIPSCVSHGILGLEQDQIYERYTINISVNYVRLLLDKIGNNNLISFLSKPLYISNNTLGLFESEMELELEILDRLVFSNSREEVDRIQFDLILLLGYIISLKNRNRALFFTIKEFSKIRELDYRDGSIDYSFKNIPYTEKTINRALKSAFGITKRELICKSKHIVTDELDRCMCNDIDICKTLGYRDVRSIKKLKDSDRADSYRVSEKQKIRMMYFLG